MKIDTKIRLLSMLICLTFFAHAYCRVSPYAMDMPQRSSIDPRAQPSLKRRRPMNFSDKILDFYENMSRSSVLLPKGFHIIAPADGSQLEQVERVRMEFYHKYYDDTIPRRLILGSSSSRLASAITGIPFEDTQHLEHLGVSVGSSLSARGSTSRFIYEVMEAYGGCDKFYSKFLMGFVCPLGLVKINDKGNEVNCNYYDDKMLQKALRPFIVESLQRQVALGVDTTVCYCIGMGKHYTFLAQLNDEYHFFEKIVPLEHPRYIMQYHSKEKDAFMRKYLSALQGT